MARRRVRKQKPQQRSGQGTRQEPPKRKTNYLKPVLGGLALTGAIVAAIANRDKLQDINLSSIEPYLSTDFGNTDLFGDTLDGIPESQNRPGAPRRLNYKYMPDTSGIDWDADNDEELVFSTPLRFRDNDTFNESELGDISSYV